MFALWIRVHPSHLAVRKPASAFSWASRFSLVSATRKTRAPEGSLDPASEEESQRDSDPKPRVARNELPWVRRWPTVSTLKGLWPEAFRAGIRCGTATTLSGLGCSF